MMHFAVEAAMTSIPPSVRARLVQRLSRSVEQLMNRAVEERAVVPLSITATLLVGAGDYATGVETTWKAPVA